MDSSLLDRQTHHGAQLEYEKMKPKSKDRQVGLLLCEENASSELFQSDHHWAVKEIRKKHRNHMCSRPLISLVHASEHL